MRFHDWQVRFERFVRERRAMRFAWGGNDCVLFAADHVEAITGVRHCPELRGHQTVRAALRLIRALGGLAAIATRALGAPLPSPRMANVGDVVLVRMGKREALGVCNGGTILGPGPDGIAVVGMADAIAAWRVA